MHIPSTISTTTSLPRDLTSKLSPGLVARPDQKELWIRHHTPIGFERAAAEVLGLHAHDGHRSDVVTADLRSWAFGTSDGTTMQVVGVPFFGRETSAPYALRELAFRQLCDRIDAPAPYIRDLPAKLQIANVNFGLLKKPQPALLRLAAGEVRAVLSEKYTAVDDALLFELVGDALDHAGLRNAALVRASAVGGSTVLRITIPGEGVAVRSGDVIEYGIDLGNSEVGIRSVQVTPTTYRLVCANGMRAWQSEATSRFRHIGDPMRLRALLTDALPLAFAEARGDLERWRRSTQIVLDSALDEIESLRSFGISGGDALSVARAHAVEAGTDVEVLDDDQLRDALRGRKVSAFEMANAITAAAKSRATTGRLLLEESAHRYLVARTR